MGDQIRVFGNRPLRAGGIRRTPEPARAVERMFRRTARFPKMESQWRAACGRRLPAWSSEPDTRQTIPRRHRHAAGVPDQGQVCAAGHRLRRHLSPAGLQELSRSEAGPSMVLLRGRCFGGGLSQGTDVSIGTSARQHGWPMSVPAPNLTRPNTALVSTPACARP